MQCNDKPYSLLLRATLAKSPSLGKVTVVRGCLGMIFFRERRLKLKNLKRVILINFLFGSKWKLLIRRHR